MKSQKLFPLVKMDEKHGGVPIHLNETKHCVSMLISCLLEVC